MARYGQIRSRFSVYLENISESPILSYFFFRQLENAGFGSKKFMVKLTIATAVFQPQPFSQAGLHERRSLGRGEKNVTT